MFFVFADADALLPRVWWLPAGDVRRGALRLQQVADHGQSRAGGASLVRPAPTIMQNSCARPAILVAPAATLIVFAISFWVLPFSFRAFKDLQSAISASITWSVAAAARPSPRSALRPDGLRARGRSRELLGVLVHDNRRLSARPSWPSAAPWSPAATGRWPRRRHGSRQKVDSETNASVLRALHHRLRPDETVDLFKFGPELAGEIATCRRSSAPGLGVTSL